MRRCPGAPTRVAAVWVGMCALMIGAPVVVQADTTETTGSPIGARNPALVVNPETSILLERTGGPGSPFRLTNITQTGSNAVVIATVGALVEPPSIVPPGNNLASQEPPLTILGGSTGFTPDDLKVYLGEGSLDGRPAQGLVLDFGTKGLAPQGVINFELSTMPPDADIRLIPEVVEALAAPPFEDPPTSGPGDSPDITVPEPMSLALWSLVMGLGLYRAQAHRRARALGRNTPQAA